MINFLSRFNRKYKVSDDNNIVTFKHGHFLRGEGVIVSDFINGEPFVIMNEDFSVFPLISVGSIDVSNLSMEVSTKKQTIKTTYIIDLIIYDKIKLVDTALNSSVYTKEENIRIALSEIKGYLYSKDGSRLREDLFEREGNGDSIIYTLPDYISDKFNDIGLTIKNIRRII